VKKFLCAGALAGALLLSSCQSGPKRLGRSWDDWVNQKYTESSWVHGALLQDILPVYPIVGLFAGIGDLFVNFYYFWWKDAWDGKGTGFEHKSVMGAEKSVAGSGM
jgi:hypothetical protein